MKTIITILVSLFVLNVSGQIQQDSVYFFNPDSTKNWWYVQKDVFSFRNNNGVAFALPYNTGIINSITYFPYSTRKQSEVRFNPNTPIPQRENEMASIRSMDSVEFVTIAITQNKVTQNDYSQQEYKRLDDVILVNFTDPNITEAEVDDFMSRNYIELVHAPSAALPTATWTYLFKISPEYTNTFQASRSIFNSEHGFITRCIPNIVGLFEPGGCQPVTEFNDFENTNAKDALWHIRNRGNAPVGGFGNGKNDADANICECWGEGYHGEGIKVVDIDYGGFDYTHPDMQGQFLTGYNLINNPVTSHTTSFWDAGGPIGHGMAVSGVIAAKANGGGQYSAVGVAYNSKIIPMLTSGSTAQITLGIQKAVEVDADIINMSLGYVDNYSSQSVLYPDIVNASTTGRGGLGIIFTASSGNNDADIKNWPAADINTIGVGATDPNDYRGSFSQSYNAWSWDGNSPVKGSNYLTPSPAEDSARYHVVAPGTLVYTSFTEDPLGAPNQRNGAWTGTSFASPLTAGIAAIILSKNAGLTVNQVKHAIMDNADQIRTSIYNYNAYSFLPGYNKEVFFGRVNCIASLGAITADLETYSLDNGINPAKLAYLNSDEIGILFDKDSNKNGCIIEVYNSFGRKVATEMVSGNIYNKTINTSSYAQGIYFIHINDNKNQYQQTLKFVK